MTNSLMGNANVWVVASCHVSSPRSLLCVTTLISLATISIVTAGWRYICCVTLCEHMFKGLKKKTYGWMSLTWWPLV